MKGYECDAQLAHMWIAIETSHVGDAMCMGRGGALTAHGTFRGLERRAYIEAPTLQRRTTTSAFALPQPSETKQQPSQRLSLAQRANLWLPLRTHREIAARGRRWTV